MLNSIASLINTVFVNYVLLFESRLAPYFYGDIRRAIKNIHTYISVN